MPDYYCNTCQKTLRRNQQRQNREQTTTRGPMVFSELDLPGNPLVGIPFNNTRSVNVVRCVTCGSDATLVYTPGEQRQSQLEQEQDSGEKSIKALLWFIFLVFSGVVLYFTWRISSYS